MEIADILLHAEVHLSRRHREASGTDRAQLTIAMKALCAERHRLRSGNGAEPETSADPRQLPAPREAEGENDGGD